MIENRAVAEQSVAHGAAARAASEIKVVHRGPVNGGVIHLSENLMNFPDPDFAKKIYERQIVNYSLMFGRSLHNIVSQADNVGDDTVWHALNCVPLWLVECSEPLKKTHEMILACGDFLGAVNSSGFCKYFETQSGNGWPHILEILRTGGDNEAHKLFSDVLSVFDNGTPSPNLEERLVQLELLGSLDTLDELFTPHDRLRDKHNYPTNNTVWKALLTLPDEDYFPLIDTKDG